MDDLISRALALEVINAVKGITWSQSGQVLCGKMYSQIKDLPAVDAAPVVRCKDCKDGKVTEHGELFCKWYYGFNPTDGGPNGYCSHGERRESE